MMNQEEITPHVKEITRVLEGKAREEDIAKDLDTYLNLYKMSLEASKRHIVRKYGGDPNTLTKGTRKMITQLGTSEQSVDLMVKVLSSNTRDVAVEGNPKVIQSGIIGDESGTIPFTVWDTTKFDLKAGECYLIRNAYTKEWSGQPKINLGNRAQVEQQDADSVKLPEGSNVSPTSSSTYSTPQTARVADLKENMNNLTLTGRILSLNQKEVETPSGKKMVYSGVIADASGKVEFSAWADFKLKNDEVITVSNAYVKGWRGIPRLTFGERAQVERPKGAFPAASELSQASRRTIEEIERAGGAADVTVIGTVVDVKKGTGLIFRCPECNRVVQKGMCQVHGKVAQVPDLRIKAIIDDGSAALTAIMKKDVTELLTGVTLKAGMEEAREAMNVEIVGQHIEERLLAKPIEVRGNVTSDEYGLMMIVVEAKLIVPDVKSEAEALLTKVEGSV
jgi:replication factor A1